VQLTGGSPSSFCHIAELGGFESTSHLRETGIPSRSGYPKPGVRVMAKDGVSKGERKWVKEGKKQVVIQNDTHETDSRRVASKLPATYTEHPKRLKHFVALSMMDVLERKELERYDVLDR
jgi:hypothetical protein